MSSNVETLSTLERRVSMSVPAADIEKQVDQRLKQMARNVRMPGFRPGKVPLKLIAKTYGPQVRSEVLGDAVQKAFSDAVRDAKLRVAGRSEKGRRTAACRRRWSSAPPSRSTRRSRSATSRARRSSGRR
jgi:trigger factor